MFVPPSASLEDALVALNPRSARSGFLYGCAPLDVRMHPGHAPVREPLMWVVAVIDTRIAFPDVSVFSRDIAVLHAIRLRLGELNLEPHLT
jgi:hypothetical protein